MNNLSIRITSDQCQGCGKCCESFEIWYDNRNGDLVNSETVRIQMLAEIGDKITIKRKIGGMWLVFNFPCRYLLSNKTCEIYDNPIRPLLCRMFPYDGTDKDSCPEMPA